jgi:two-component system, OmpR family, sensor histidine kinase KdpD
VAISGFMRSSGSGRRGAALAGYSARGSWAGDYRPAGLLATALAGWFASVVLVAAATGAAVLVQAHVTLPPLAVLYLLAVVPVAVVWGAMHAVSAAVLSLLVFDFLFVPPAYALTPADPRSWPALPVFVITAVAASELAARSRRQARESALLARVATCLLEQGEVSGALDRVTADVAGALGVEQARILTSQEGLRPGGADAFPLMVGGRLVGTIILQPPLRGGSAARRRVLPALASLLAVAIDREWLAREAVETEALRRSDAVKTAILRTVSHDLRTPLMAILTAAGALARPGFVTDDGDRADLLATVLEESRRLDRLVGNLLDLSRLQAGAAEPRADAVAVGDLIADAIDYLGAEAGRVEAWLGGGSPVVRADAHQVQRILVNLIENALKYSPATEPVRVRVTATSAEALVRVIDHGPGVPPGESERIFGAFQRGTGSGGVHGAGLGLAIAEGFAEANGGRIWLESHERQGTTFVLALPLLHATDTS